MSRTDSNQEIEIKLRVPGVEAARSLILGAGYDVSVPRTFEVNSILDTPDTSLRQRGMLLRLRKAGAKFTMTVKGQVSEGKHKSRPEYEVVVSDYAAAQSILFQLGYQTVFQYEKFRTEFTSTNQPGTITLDETPIGIFLELEGPADWIDRTANALGFSQSDYVVESYGTLYSNCCMKRGAVPSHMVF